MFSEIDERCVGPPFRQISVSGVVDGLRYGFLCGSAHFPLVLRASIHGELIRGVP
jgi:hypothetical protein